MHAVHTADCDLHTMNFFFRVPSTVVRNVNDREALKTCDARVEAIQIPDFVVIPLRCLRPLCSDLIALVFEVLNVVLLDSELVRDLSTCCWIAIVTIRRVV